MKNCIMITLAGFLFCGCLFQEPENLRSMAEIPGVTPGTPGAPASDEPPVYYSQFGARGDGVTDDFDAIRRAHAAANQSGATVKADPGATYYIGSTTKTAFIQTDTDWGDAKFIIDDTTIVRRGSQWADSWIFQVESAQKPVPVHSVSGLRKNQPRLSVNLGCRALLIAIDNTTRRYIRQGVNESAGDLQKDVFIVDKNGFVDQRAPVIWDFNNISSLMAYPIDERQLKVTGGRFTTIASRATNNEGYMKRGICIIRSNTVIDGIYHDVAGQEELPIVAYYGFFYIINCADIIIKNCTLTGHLSMESLGTYDIQSEATVNLSIIDCGQTNDIADQTWWGVHASNHSKNMILENVRFSRFDAHRGIYNVTIKNSQMGHMSMRAVGSGDVIIEDTTVSGALNYFSLRSDYGSTWDGNLYIKNATFIPRSSGAIISASNGGQWNFGYPCCMPKFIYIEGFHVVASGNRNVQLVTNNDLDTPEEWTLPQPFPYALTDTIYIKGFTADTGRKYLTDNNFLFDSNVNSNCIKIKEVW